MGITQLCVMLCGLSLIPSSGWTTDFLAYSRNYYCERFGARQRARFCGMAAASGSVSVSSPRIPFCCGASRPIGDVAEPIRYSLSSLSMHISKSCDSEAHVSFGSGSIRCQSASGRWIQRYVVGDACSHDSYNNCEAWTMKITKDMKRAHQGDL